MKNARPYSKHIIIIRLMPTFYLIIKGTNFGIRINSKYACKRAI